MGEHFESLNQNGAVNLAGLVAHHWYAGGDVDRALGIRGSRGRIGRAMGRHEGGCHALAQDTQLWPRTQDPVSLTALERDTILMRLDHCYNNCSLWRENLELLEEEDGTSPQTGPVKRLWLDLRRNIVLRALGRAPLPVVQAASLWSDSKHSPTRMRGLPAACCWTAFI